MSTFTLCLVVAVVLLYVGWRSGREARRELGEIVEASRQEREQLAAGFAGLDTFATGRIGDDLAAAPSRASQSSGPAAAPTA